MLSAVSKRESSSNQYSHAARTRARRREAAQRSLTISTTATATTAWRTTTTANTRACAPVFDGVLSAAGQPLRYLAPLVAYLPLRLEQ